MTSRVVAHFAALIGGLFILGISVCMLFFESAYRRFQQLWLFSGAQLSTPSVRLGWKVQEKIGGVIFLPVGLVVMLIGLQDAPSLFEALLVVGCALVSAVCLFLPGLVLRWSVSRVATGDSLPANLARTWTVGIRILGIAFVLGAFSMMTFWRR